MGSQRVALSTLALFVAGCAGPGPDVVWVPDEGFATTVRIAVDLPAGGARVGEPLVLHAERRSGPWSGVSADSLSEGACRVAGPPPELEPEVQANVHWLVEPAGGAVFNLPQAADIHLRTVMFTAPGVYRLRARSHAWCGEPVLSEVLEIVVVG
jgi:hypothetical protein